MSRSKSSYQAFIAATTLLVASSLPGTAQDDDALVKRGEYLMNGPVACGNCHDTRAEDMSPVPGKEFAGGFRIVDTGIDAYAANITQDAETGIGTWTDEEIITAIREGTTPEGDIIFPPMPVPSYNMMSDDDVKAIVAYLRTVKGVHNEVPESTYGFPQQPMPPAKGEPAPDPSDQVAYGGYIVNALSHCFECHTGPDANGVPDFANALGAGGFMIQLAPGAVVSTPNITSDPETGLGKWSDEDIKKAITQGVRPDGTHLSPPMPFPFFANMTPEDLDAVVAYVRTIPPIVNKVERTEFQKTAFP
ncbi:c-type cytochrome [Bauldia litoralis]|uniref:Cytochrome c, mono-and diheme variants n=1 Tax=Bauldia litoralis TaxID=665467 RepID=A0A1G6CQ40_9HYPH|nr:c-type cytochrome [Bauldia litoralis]SDB35017.1 Cytochrome c, mono-and diheme variants [Bauldia litoralis]